MVRFTLYFTLFLFIQSCQWIGQSADIEQKTIALDTSFRRLELASVFEVTLVQSDTFRLHIRASERSISNVRYTLKNNTLKVWSESPAHWLDGYEPTRLTIYHDTLERMQISAPVTILNRDTLHYKQLRIVLVTEMAKINLALHTNYLYVVNSDTGDGVFRFSGYARKARFWQRGVSSVQALQLRADEVRVRQNSLQPCYVNARNKLQVSIDRPAHVYYTGQPAEVKWESETAGQLLPWNE